VVVALAAFGLASCAEGPITLHGAVQFADDHAFNRTLLEFERLTKEYYGNPLEFVLHRNGDFYRYSDRFGADIVAR
jgi:hypothetical protein